MLEEFKDLYIIHGWLRYVTWVGLIAAALFILLMADGFPPLSWFLLVQEISRLPQTFQRDGGLALLPVLLLSGLSTLFLLAWCLLGWIALLLARYHWREALRMHSLVGVVWAPSFAGITEESVDDSLSTPSSLSFEEEGDTVLVATPLRAESEVQTSRPALVSATVLSNPGCMDDANQISTQVRAQTHSSDVSRDQHSMMEEAQVISMPRLQLPQKQQPSSQLVKLLSYPTAPAGLQKAIYEIPTRPVDSAPVSSGSLPRLPAQAQQKPRLVQPVEVGVGWNSGITRQHTPNEDSLVVLQGTCTYQGRLVPFGLFVVADGMGGHAYGQEASRMAIQSMMQMVLQNIVMSNELNDDFLVEMLVGGVEWANQAIFQRSQEWGKEMGTTLTAALVVGRKAYVVNVGDSRTYLYRPGIGLTPITRDHSLVASLVAAGEITPDEVYTHPERNKVYRSLGGREQVEVDWFVLDLYEEDRLLLCSDGLWEMVRDPEIERVMRYVPDPLRVSDVLVQAALHGGGRDNVSVIVVRVPS